jgi:hypothetical protein
LTGRKSKAAAVPSGDDRPAGMAQPYRDFAAGHEASARAAARAATTRAERARHMLIAYQWTAVRWAEEARVAAIAARLQAREAERTIALPAPARPS